jgi:hypothetical protein
MDHVETLSYEIFALFREVIWYWMQLLTVSYPILQQSVNKKKSCQCGKIKCILKEEIIVSASRLKIYMWKFPK